VISDLASQLKRILPFAEKAIEESVEESTDLLRRTIERLYTAMIDTAQFICVYVKQSRFSTYILLYHFPKANFDAERATKFIISPQTQERINGFKDEFGKLVEDFDRAVDIETMKIARNIGKQNTIVRVYLS
jgi:hypothetical protein